MDLWCGHGPLVSLVRAWTFRAGMDLWCGRVCLFVENERRGNQRNDDRNNQQFFPFYFSSFFLFFKSVVVVCFILGLFCSVKKQTKKHTRRFETLLATTVTWNLK